MHRFVLPAVSTLVLTLGLGSTNLLADHHLAGEHASEAPADNTLTDAEEEAGWTLMFNGENLDGWKMSEVNADSVHVADGMIVTNGPCGHLFYGEDGNASFDNFEFTADVYSVGKSNSGIYIQTAYQKESWPNKGFECQIANSYGDPRKTASLYAIDDIAESPAQDDAWFNYRIRVEGDTVRIWINGELANEWTQPEDWDNADRNLDNNGTFALQAHDPNSVVRFKNLKVRELE